METIDVVTILIAVWGAILSTILGVRELIKEKRQIHAYIDFIDRFEKPWIRVLNNGHRPVTLTSVELWFYQKKGWRYIFERSISLDLASNIDTLDHQDAINLPLTLSDGEYVGFTILSDVNDSIFASYYAKHLLGDWLARLYIVDASLKYYEVKKGRRINPRFEASSVKFHRKD